jgi:UDP-glucose 4-epimerase
VEHLLNGGESKFYNLGSGQGYSNKEIVEAVRKVTGVDLEIKFGPRRAGDSPRLLASVDKVKAELGWVPEYTNIEDIVRTAWAWEQKKG